MEISKKIRLRTFFKMVVTFVCVLIIAALFIFFESCTTSGNKPSETSAQAENHPNNFKPVPQHVAKHEVHTLEIGSLAPDFRLPDVTGRYYQLSDFNPADILVIIFTCNHCPTAQAYEDRIIRFTEDYKDKGVSVAAVMPNSSLSLLLEECGYTDLDDTYESMVIRAKDKGFNFPYLYDGDSEEASVKYGPMATPHAFVFDKNRHLVYTGRLDASEKPGTANAEDLRFAVDALINGNPVAVQVNKTFGCSIKWAWKTEWTDKMNKDWEEKPVKVEEISQEGIVQLITNKTSKLRLINVWATWCGPCIIEYPELVNLQRMYGQRNFEFVSISADKPENTSQVLEFLATKHSAVLNYIFDRDDKYALVEAIDPAWNGALPYSILVEPGGKRIYSAQGTVDLLKLKKAIVEHPLMGRYY
jgi:thiol-disulfide isomerase/thioredoxin